MHLSFVTIGNNHDVEKTIEQLQAKYLPFKFFDSKDGKFIENTEKNYLAQVIVREVRFWECIFPEEYQDVMLNTILGENEGKINIHDKGKARLFESYLWGLRKMMGYQPIPKYKKEEVLPLYKYGTHFIGLGVKDDRKKENKEML